MSGKELMKGLSYINRSYIEEAETSALKKHSFPLKKTLLIAAIVSLLVLLAGCVAVFLGWQERKIGEMENHRNFDVYGAPLETPQADLELVSMAGLEGTPAWQASKEWFEYTQNHVVKNLTNEVDDPDIPNNLEHTYSCWDQEMVEKLTQIAEKYDMKLLGENSVAQRWQREAAFDALGISGLIREGAKADYRYGACQTYQPHNFRADVTLTLSGEDAAWNEEVFAEFYYLQTGYLSPNDVFTYDPNGDQWTYKTADGRSLLLALSGTEGLILCQREDAAIVVHLSLYWKNVFLQEEMASPSRQSMEQIADCFDFSIVTNALEDGLQAKFDAIPDPNAVEAPVILEDTCETYAQFIDRFLYPEFMEYVLYDLDRDGQEELLIGYGDGTFEWKRTIRDGKVDHFDGLELGPIRLCKNNLILVEGETIVNSYQFVKSMTPTATGVKTANVCKTKLEDGAWTLNDEPCTEAEAKAAMAQYTPLELDWKPLTEFPMDDGRTFAEVLAEEYRPRGQSLLSFYAANAPKDKRWTGGYQYYLLRDLNGDGVEDLLVSHDGEYIDWAYTVRRGNLETCGARFWLCRDNMQMNWGDWEGISTGKCKRYHFSREEGDRSVFYEYYLHNEQTDTWYDELGRPLADGVNPLAMYPREELQMRPIRELLNNG